MTQIHLGWNSTKKTSGECFLVYSKVPLTRLTFRPSRCSFGQIVADLTQHSVHVQTNKGISAASFSASPASTSTIIATETTPLKPLDCKRIRRFRRCVLSYCKYISAKNMLSVNLCHTHLNTYSCNVLHTDIFMERFLDFYWFEMDDWLFVWPSKFLFYIVCSAFNLVFVLR